MSGFSELALGIENGKIQVPAGNYEVLPETKLEALNLAMQRSFRTRQPRSHFIERRLIEDVHRLVIAITYMAKLHRGSLSDANMSNFLLYDMPEALVQLLMKLDAAISENDSFGGFDNFDRTMPIAVWGTPRNPTQKLSTAGCRTIDVDQYDSIRLDPIPGWVEYLSLEQIYSGFAERICDCCATVNLPCQVLCAVNIFSGRNSIGLGDFAEHVSGFPKELKDFIRRSKSSILRNITRCADIKTQLAIKAITDKPSKDTIDFDDLSIPRYAAEYLVANHHRVNCLCNENAMKLFRYLSSKGFQDLRY